MFALKLVFQNKCYFSYLDVHICHSICLLSVRNGCGSYKSLQVFLPMAGYTVFAVLITS